MADRAATVIFKNYTDHILKKNGAGFRDEDGFWTWGQHENLVAPDYVPSIWKTPNGNMAPGSVGWRGENTKMDSAPVLGWAIYSLVDDEQTTININWESVSGSGNLLKIEVKGPKKDLFDTSASFTSDEKCCTQVVVIKLRT